MNNHIQEYFKAVCEKYRIGNIESSYNAPLITMMTAFGCSALDLSGERSEKEGQNTDIKLWRGGDVVTETEQKDNRHTRSRMELSYRWLPSA